LSVAIGASSSENPEDSALPKTIQLSDGTKLSFLGLTYGTRHAAPGFENLPTGNWIFTREGSTVAWIQAQHDPNKWPSFELLVSDKAKTGCVATEKRSSSHVKNGVEVLGFVLDAFPRWEKEMIFRARPFYGPIAAGQIVVSNSVPESIAKWSPEQLPSTKSDGDFQVTLTNIIAGVPSPHKRGDPAPVKDPANQCVRMAFGFQQNGHSVTNWRPLMVQTSDATGNHVRNVISEYPQNGVYIYPQARSVPTGSERVLYTLWRTLVPQVSGTPVMHMDGYFYRPGLWPDESPWKVRLEFLRTADFSAEEIFTATNLVVRTGTEEEANDEWSHGDSKTNFIHNVGTVNGVKLKILEPLQHPVAIQSGKKFITVLIYGDPNPKLQGMHLTLVEATDDQGQALWSFTPDWAGHYDLQFDVSRNIKSLNLKLALHKSRFVEFTVKPDNP